MHAVRRPAAFRATDYWSENLRPTDVNGCADGLLTRDEGS